MVFIHTQLFRLQGVADVIGISMLRQEMETLSVFHSLCFIVASMLFSIIPRISYIIPISYNSLCVNRPPLKSSLKIPPASRSDNSLSASWPWAACGMKGQWRDHGKENGNCRDYGDYIGCI